MGGVNVDGGGGGGRKSVDAEIPLVPFIDLLLCCIMFLLVTAVWNQLARIDASQKQPGQPDSEQEPPEEEEERWVLRVTAAGYALATTDGEQRFEVPKKADDYDMDALIRTLKDRATQAPDRHDLVVAPDDDVPYTHIIEAMDTAVGEGFTDLALSDSSILAAVEEQAPQG